MVAAVTESESLFKMNILGQFFTDPDATKLANQSSYMIN
jgi:hypothetical protein